jgi:hypothetical protein
VRAHWVGTAIASAAVLVLLAILIVPRAGEVGDALGRVGAGRFAAIVLLGIAALLCRTIGWQVAVDAAGGQVHAAEAHAASSVGWTVALLNPYLGTAVRIGILRRTIPERSPTAAQLVAAESVSFVVESALVSVLILSASWTLGIPLYLALLIVLAGIAAVGAVVFLARHWTAPRFAAGLAVAREPRSLAAVTAALAGALLSQLGRVALALSSVDLHASPIIVIAVFVASGVSAVIPIGTAAAGAAAPLIAAGSGGDDVANATAAGVLLSATLLAATLIYLLITMLVAARFRRSLRASRHSS